MIRNKYDYQNTLGNEAIKSLHDQHGLIHPYDESLLQPSSYDLRLGYSYKINKYNSYNTFNKECIDPKLPITYVEKSLKDEYIYPGQFMIVDTIEVIDLRTINEHLIKNNIGIRAIVCGKSSLGRIGLMVENAGFIDPGFKGTITLELYNQEKYPIKLYPEMTICQIEFTMVSGIDKLYQGKYIGQKGPTESRYYKNFTN